MNLQDYLLRIGISEPVRPTLSYLQRIQQRHLLSVPYENMDIVRGVPLSLEVEDLYDKIIVRGRGGYCFELNRLYAWLLRSVGFDVTDHFARFLRDETEIPMRRHHVLSVRVPGADERYLCDVGVGTGSPTFPVAILPDVEQPQANGVYRLKKDDFLGWVLEELRHDQWRPVFSFTEDRQLPVDFIATSFYCEKSDASIFNKAPMVAIRTGDGRRTIDGNAYKEFSGDDVHVLSLDNDLQLAECLREKFGILLP